MLYTNIILTADFESTATKDSKDVHPDHYHQETPQCFDGSTAHFPEKQKPTAFRKYTLSLDLIS